MEAVRRTGMYTPCTYLILVRDVSEEVAFEETRLEEGAKRNVDSPSRDPRSIQY